MKVPPLHALYDKLYRADILSHAWRLVKANKGSPGIDGIDFATIENGIGVDGYLLELSLELQDKTYRASTVRRIMIRGNRKLRNCRKQPITIISTTYFRR